MLQIFTWEKSVLYQQDEAIVMKTKYSVHIIVFGVVTSDGDIVAPFISPHDLRFNTEFNIKCLEELMLT